MSTIPVIDYLKELLDNWERSDTKGEIRVVRMDSGDIDVIPAPRKRFRKGDMKNKFR